MVGCHRVDMDAVDDMDRTWTGHGRPTHGRDREGGVTEGDQSPPRPVLLPSLLWRCRAVVSSAIGCPTKGEGWPHICTPTGHWNYKVMNESGFVPFMDEYFKRLQVFA